MKKYITHIYLSSLILSLGYSQEIKTEVIRTNSILNVPAGQKIECLSAEGKYTYDTTFGGSFVIYKGPRLKITKDMTEFVYPVAPIGVEDYQAVFRGISMVGYSSLPLSWVFSGDGSSLTIDGPVSISYQNTSSSNGEPFLFTYKVFSALSNNVVSASSVVIPTSATGDVDVKMEQSADNVTWTECLPGTYNSSTVKRFFRLRAVEK